MTGCKYEHSDETFVDQQLWLQKAYRNVDLHYLQ